MGVVTDATEQTLRALSDLRAEQRAVLSLYLDLDPARFATPPARATEIDSLLDAAHREIEADERPHEERQALRAALERARTMLSENGWTQGARAAALFVCEPLELALLLRLSHPVVAAAVISDAPFIAPLAETVPSGRICVALVDERLARFLRGSGEKLEEAVSFGDPVHGWHKQGGWSQARYQRSIYEDAEAHLRNVARTLADLLRVAPYDHLLIACAEPLWSRVLGRLHPDVRARLHEERLSLDVGDATIADVEDAAAPVLAELAQRRADEVLAQLREHRGRAGDGRAAVGLGEVLEALVERRVGALLYEAGLRARGVLCTRCRWMAPAGDRCPVDGGTLEERDSIVEEAVQSALGQSAEVLVLRDRPELGPLGGIAATLRF